METNDVVDPYICTEISAQEWRDEPCFRAILSDGKNVYSKYNRRSWLELKAWLEVNTGVKIIGLYVQFRDNVIEVGTGLKNYLFAHGVLSWYGTGVSQQLYITGYQEGNHVLVKKYITPEMLLQEMELRSLEDPIVKRGLIKGEE